MAGEGWPCPGHHSPCHATVLTWLKEAAVPWSSAPGSVLSLGLNQGRPWKVAGGSRARVEGWATAVRRGHLVFNSCTGQTRALCPLGLHAAEELVTSTLSLPLGRMGQGTTLPSSQGVRGREGGVLAIFSGLSNFNFFKVYL